MEKKRHINLTDAILKRSQNSVIVPSITVRSMSKNICFSISALLFLLMSRIFKSLLPLLQKKTLLLKLQKLNVR